mmetsp:Transcript_28686/g.92549  ORF Transcript_28686/g.92549 Transcript_28686/m.92549 type:complete len:87 (-) Transcript_28686:861-1121(-)
MEVKVHLFAKAKELAGGSLYITCRLEGSSILCRDFLENHVFEVEPKLRVLKDSAYLAVNDNYVLPEDRLDLKETDDIAFIPPISGG